MSIVHTLLGDQDLPLGSSSAFYLKWLYINWFLQWGYFELHKHDEIGDGRWYHAGQGASGDTEHAAPTEGLSRLNTLQNVTRKTFYKEFLKTVGSTDI